METRISLFSRLLPGWTLFRKEVLRFIAVPAQTIFTPVISAALYLFIFGVSLGGKISLFPDLSYLQFVIPGLILMVIINNSFSNSSSSLFFARYLGNIVDLLVTPLSPTALVLAYSAAAIVRGLLVGLVVLGVSLAFSPLPFTSPWLALAMAILVSLMMGLLGLVCGIYSETFEGIAMYTNFLLMPLVYLGGLFYPLSLLPPFWQKLSHANPIYYAIDGFRTALLGHGEVALGTSFAVILTCSAGFAVWAGYLFSIGHKLRQ